MQAAGTDIFGAFVDLPGDLGQAHDAGLDKLQMDPFGGQQGLVLFGQGGIRFGQDALELLYPKGIKLDANRQAAL